MKNAERSRQAAVIIWSGLIVTAVLLLSRRVAGGMNSISSAAPCVAISTLATLLSGLAWCLFQNSGAASRPPRVEQFAALVAWLPACLSGLAVLPANSPFARGWLIGVSVLSATVLALSGRWHQVAEEPLAEILKPSTPLPLPATELAEVPEPELGVFQPLNSSDSDSTTTQWMTRQTLTDGAESLEGSIRVSFRAGQRAASVHVPFAPPFAAVPQVECEIVSEDDIRWKVSVVYAYGMRVELKRDANRDAAEIELAYSAVCDAVSADAA